MAPVPLTHVPQHEGGLVGQGQDLLHLVQEGLPIRIEPHPLAVPVKQRHPQLRLQIGDGLGQGGLGDVQFLRRPGDVLQPGHRAKIIQLGQLHSIPSIVLLSALMGRLYHDGKAEMACVRFSGCPARGEKTAEPDVSQPICGYCITCVGQAQCPL